jgi:hypothetical protein
MELRPQHLLRRQKRLVLGDQRGRRCPRERVLDDLVILGCAEQHADRGPFMRLLDVAIERLDVERELPEIGGLELVDLQLKGDETLQTSVEEHEVDREVLVTDLDGVLRTDEAEVATELGQEAAQVPQERAVEVGLVVLGGEAKKLEAVGVLELVVG